MSNRLLYAALVVAAATMIGFYVLEMRTSEDGEQAQEQINEQSDAGEGGVINVDQEIERTRHLQPERKAIIDGMLEGGLASRIENPAGAPFIYVLEPFYMLSTEEQTSLLNVVLYYYMTEDPGSDVLTIFSDETGQEIGTYTPSGLLMGQ